MNSNYHERYNRQLILTGFGSEAQDALSASSVLVIGAGGLGCPCLLYLAAAGIGRIGIVDHDRVSLSNLHRQTLYNTSDIGKLKTEVASLRLLELNPDIHIDMYPFQLDPINAVELISAYQYIVDGSDNFATRYLVNDVCSFLKKPLVFAAVSQYEGQVAVFNVADKVGQTINYRDLFPIPPQAGEIPNCAEAGVLGVLPGIIGTMQAAELIKLVTGIGAPLVNKMLTYEILNQEVLTIDLVAPAVKSYSIPETAEEFRTMQYQLTCDPGATGVSGVRSSDGEGDHVLPSIEEVDFTQLQALMRNQSTVLIDVRENGETPAVTGLEYIQIPLSVFPVFAEGIEEDNVILFCQAGSRSLKAAAMLKDLGGSNRKIYSLKGGVLSLNRN